MTVRLVLASSDGGAAIGMASLRRAAQDTDALLLAAEMARALGLDARATGTGYGNGMLSGMLVLTGDGEHVGRVVAALAGHPGAGVLDRIEAETDDDMLQLYAAADPAGIRYVAAAPSGDTEWRGTLDELADGWRAL